MFSLFLEIIAQWFLLILFLVELGAKVYLNKEHQMATVRDQSTYDEISQRQRGTALSVASLVFAGITLLLSQNAPQYVEQIEVFVVAFGFLLIAAFAHEITLTRRIMLTIQEMALEYGLLMLGFGVYLLISEIVEGASFVALGVFSVVMIIRFASTPGELQAHQNT
ncbi:hypothetical protein DM826_06575 [Halonotius aquaticus]|uniref:Uncharacterized protein n=1 Tax=Halonotius aquaticus TaxID=2216978 RepID=A0A3A6PNT2_9EURY|nr:hypothetical protein [Halonotius aquaticus]RJX43269.1 hypothetical protein DM826_06575 [Halonotius aquaticus]